MKLTPAGWLRMLLAGAIEGSLFDGFHTHSGTTEYPSPVLWMMAWWTPLVFAAAYTAGGVAYAILRARWGAKPIPVRTAVVCFFAFALLYFMSGYLPASNLVKLLVLLAGAAAMWLATDRAPSTLIVGGLAAVIGPVSEMIQVHFGAFAHLQPDFAGIPIWLPALYLASAPGAGPLFAWLGYGDAGFPLSSEQSAARPA